jgi:hydrogenase expression/formation protein HypD
MKYIKELKDPTLSREIVKQIKKISKKKIRLMEVCGTHTTSIFRNGIRGVLPDSISLISGPGCPVCVTSQNEIDSFIALAGTDNVIVATFGDLIRVPGSQSSLEHERAKARRIHVVSSPVDALDIAKQNPDKKVVFLGVGFETTAPAIAGSIILARDLKIKNYFVYSAHKLVPPALTALMETNNAQIDGFMLPGHVSMITGVKAYVRFFDQYKIPCVVAGFEAVDMLCAVFMLVKQIETDSPNLENAYKRAVGFRGNEKAQEILHNVFKTVDATWRGIGTIPQSGLKLKDEFECFDAEKKFDIKTIFAKEPESCCCGEILTGAKIPPECALYKKVCTPINPVGPCMVSTEGSCAAYFRYYLC